MCAHTCEHSHMHDLAASAGVRIAGSAAEIPGSAAELPGSTANSADIIASGSGDVHAGNPAGRACRSHCSRGGVHVFLVVHVVLGFMRRAGRHDLGRVSLLGFARDARVWISRASCTLWIRYFHYFVRKAYKKTKSATIAMRVPASYRRNHDIACMVFATHDCFTIQRWTIRVAIH